MFSLSLRSVVFPRSPRITIVGDTTTVTIVDDDRKYNYLHKYVYQCLLTAIKVNFSESMYFADEHSENLPVTLRFSNPSSTDIAIHVRSTEQNATSKYTIVINKVCYADFHCRRL